MAVALAERVEKTGGPKAGLLAWKTLADTSSPGDTRARALLSALRCAFALTDLRTVSELTTGWEVAGDGIYDKQIGALCKDLARAGLLVPALALASAELSRRRSAFAHYLYARCLDVAGDPRAADSFAHAIAEKDATPELALAARVRRVAWTNDAEEAAQIDLARISPSDRILVARALLGSPSRFVRAGAIASLDGILLTGDVELAKRALAVCAAYVDDRGDVITSLEHDRLLALFSRDAAVAIAPRAKNALRAASALAQATNDDKSFDAALIEAQRLDPTLAPLHFRARQILLTRGETGASEGIAPNDPWSLLLDVFVALRDGAPSRATGALRMLAEAQEKGQRLPAQVWNVIPLALSSDDAEVRAVAGRLAAARMKTPGAPPRGWLELANALAMREMPVLADRARRAAAAAKEPGANDALVFALTRSAWELARSGDRSLAIARLREARALSQKDPAVANADPHHPSAPADPSRAAPPDASRSK